MDPSKIGGSNWFPDQNSLGRAKKQEQEEKAIAKNKDAKDTQGLKAGKELGGLLKLPADKVVNRLSSLLEKALKDPSVNQLLTETKIPAHSQQAIALCTWSCLKQLFGKRLNLSAEEEKAILRALEEEYEKDLREQDPTDPDEKRKKKEDRKRQKEKRKQQNSAKVNAVLKIIEESISRLEGDKTLSIES